MLASIWTKRFLAAGATLILVLRWKKRCADLEAKLDALQYMVYEIANRDRGPKMSKKLDDIGETLEDLLKDSKRLNSP
ncbi:hypothetical protein N0V86_000652 [Didymella sp. IMI 355093]|nr:hypothetical protein N0V86_000652 [Didymella sp. IMI 355093]